VIWSHRVDADLAVNRLTTTLAALRAEGRSIIDLTLSNPTIADFVQNNVTPAWDEFQAPPVPPVTIVVR